MSIAPLPFGAARRRFRPFIGWLVGVSVLVQRMAADGTTDIVECGPGKVLQGLVKKIVPTATVGNF